MTDGIETADIVDSKTNPIDITDISDSLVALTRKYVLDLLKETGMLGGRPCDTPLELGQKLIEDQGREPVDRRRYQRLVGKLIYLSHLRLDIAIAVSIVSQFMHAPRTSNLETVIRILRYLKTSAAKGLYFSKHGYLGMKAFTNADWTGSVSDRRSTSGYCTFVGSNFITWQSKKQNVVAKSSAEAEFRAMTQGVCELLWIRLLLEDLTIHQTDSMRLYCDNKVV
ncbi:uncharacterized protein LOC114259975 [Camellia sinensis]|uniref:uncharacterized protein LOC114259975 n=1 Tax=Camellia sinensis TaxID=4442 RepID=UPI0010363A39|nr:uncharacterized protein LOC114259975 [Camellia sinensis]